MQGVPCTSFGINEAFLLLKKRTGNNNNDYTTLTEGFEFLSFRANVEPIIPSFSIREVSYCSALSRTGDATRLLERCHLISSFTYSIKCYQVPDI